MPARAARPRHNGPFVVFVIFVVFVFENRERPLTRWARKPALPLQGRSAKALYGQSCVP